MTDLQLKLTRFETFLDQIATTSREFKQDLEDLRTKYEKAQLERDQDRQPVDDPEGKPFVVLLVDGNRYLFQDGLTDRGTYTADSGHKIANRLHELLKLNVTHLGLRNCDIIVRAYANFAELSTRLEMSEGELSIPGFVTAFNSAHDLYDFVDAGDNTRSKISAVLRQFVGDPLCKHIYFAGCHDTAYVELLTPQVQHVQRMTLVGHEQLQDEFIELAYAYKTYLKYSTTALSPSPFKDLASDLRPHQTQTFSTTSAASGWTMCSSEIGRSELGGEPGSTEINTQFQTYQEDVRWTGPGGAPQSSWLNSPAKNDSGSTSECLSNASTNTTSGTLALKPPAGHFAAGLPTRVPRGKIAVNSTGHRLDQYHLPISTEDTLEYKKRNAIAKLCNSFHVLGYCFRRQPGDGSCPYDHAPVSPGVLKVQTRNMHQLPCKFKGACRRHNCMNGHICQSSNCLFRGGKWACKFLARDHKELVVEKYVDGMEKFEVKSMPEEPTDDMLYEGKTTRASKWRDEPEAELEDEVLQNHTRAWGACKETSANFQKRQSLTAQSVLDPPDSTTEGDLYTAETDGGTLQARREPCVVKDSWQAGFKQLYNDAEEKALKAEHDTVKIQEEEDLLMGLDGDDASWD
ncbi:hypothetical protein LTR97_011204 [Elasticomyces elasticus]|uniref:C3H1-type domain-containing protein n=1 Tax=Elasticomyces elasticus TaxID=574655 RepID=A0AAN7VZF7_9PEZI|nr:hypothetical protein LTR97_011204 [Elasticomyces elasticus]